MTTHEFAKQLLAGPNITVVVPKVLEYDDDPDDSCADPMMSIEDALENGDPVKVAMISYHAKEKETTAAKSG